MSQASDLALPAGKVAYKRTLNAKPFKNPLTPTDGVVGAVVRRPLEEGHRNEVVEVHPFYEHPHEHRRPPVLQQNEETLAQNWLPEFTINYF